MAPPIDERRRMKDTIEQSKPGAHRGNTQREQSDPPTSFTVEDEPTPSFAKPGIRTGLAHLSDGIAASSKRIAFMMAAWGTISSAGGAIFIWWGSHQDYVKQDQMAVERARNQKVERAVERIELMVSLQPNRLDKLETKVEQHTEQLAQLPRVTARKKKELE